MTIDYSYHGSYREINTQILKIREDSLAIRIFIRLVLLYQQGQLTGNQWKAISALKSHRESMIQTKELDLLAINADIELIREVMKSNLSESDLQDLYWRVSMICLNLQLRLFYRP